MRRTAAFRGQPLLVLLAMLAAWAGLRAAWWPMPGVAADRSVPILAARRWISGLSGQAAAAPAALAETTFGPSVPPLRAPGGPDVAAAIPLHPTGVELGEEATPVDVFGHPLRPVPTGVAIGHTLLLAAGLSQLDLPPALAAYLGLSAPQVPGIPAATPTMAHLPPAGTGATGPRLSAAAWVMVRDDTAPVAAGLPSYGRSQAGAVVRYRLAPSSRFDPQMYARATGALSGPLEQDLAAGMSARLAKVPLRVGVEMRLSRTNAGSEVRPALVTVTEFPPLDLPLGVRGEVYAQAGYVGGTYATPFVDGQARVERQLVRLGAAEISAGAGAWGGAQEGAARLDVGPTATVAFRVGEARGRLAADYRFRVAGDAEPRSGPALTVSAGF